MAEMDNGWVEYKRLVLKQLEDLTEEIKSLNMKVEKITTDIAVLKTKMALYGGVAGLVVSFIVSLVLNMLKVK